MAACAHGAGYESCPPRKVSTEFNQADKGTKRLSDAMRTVKHIAKRNGGIVKRRLEGGLLQKPDDGSANLVQPVIWDKIRNQNELNPYTTEGAMPYAGGANKGIKWDTTGVTGSGGYDLYGGNSNSATTPSGTRVIFSPVDPYGKLNESEVSFYHPGEEMVPEKGQGNTKQAISRFGEVYDAIKQYVDKYKPDALHFTAATDSHAKLYNKVAPMMAKDLGGTLRQFDPLTEEDFFDPTLDNGFYSIDLSARKYRKRGGQVKLDKNEVHYRPGSGGNRCANCTMFRNPNACTLVSGYIAPAYTCDRFDAKEKRASGGRMRMPDIILIRHGATKLNATTATSVDHIRGWKDVPLSDEGKKEAEKLAQQCKSLGIEVLYCSDLSRAHETAKAIGNAIGIKPVPVKGLRPWNLGEFTGQNSKLAVPKIAEYVKTPDKTIPEGESFNSFRNRTFSELKTIINRHPGKRIAIVTHHRVERLLKAWKAKGEPATHDIDVKVFSEKGEDTGHAEKFPVKTL